MQKRAKRSRSNFQTLTATLTKIIKLIIYLSFVQILYSSNCYRRNWKIFYSICEYILYAQYFKGSVKLKCMGNPVLYCLGKYVNINEYAMFVQWNWDLANILAKLISYNVQTTQYIYFRFILTQPLVYTCTPPHTHIWVWQKILMIF